MSLGITGEKTIRRYYIIIYVIHNNSFPFSQDFINKTNEILSYDTNFMEIYENLRNQIINVTNNNENNIPPEESIGGADENANEQEINEEKPVCLKSLGLINLRK